ncbi:MAG: sigma-70 family RNA polymerase sigma factor [Chitinispirillales bacterium]|jgi:RNA polymerase sigma-70 factor (ECF subfamily)|nr:sigma-70 family RNA polymerase sigma factor [Chitinispirillales bacterium]
MSEKVAGDRAQFADTEALFRKYGPMVLRRCNHLLVDADAAADAAQEVFVKFIENRHRLDVKYPSSLLFTIATNHCLNLIRDGKIRRTGADRDSFLERIACANDIEERQGHRDMLRKLFGRSPKSSRAIAILYYVDGMTLEETAREVKMSVSGVRKRLTALRQTLAELEEL